MPKPCSLDLRMRLLEAVIAGASRREAADCFDSCGGALEHPACGGGAARHHAGRPEGPDGHHL